MEVEERKYDFLKYWRIIRYYFRVKYDLSQEDLDMLLFLTWDRNRINRLKNKGWIEIFRRHNKNSATIYQLTYKASRVVTSLYRIVNGGRISLSSQSPLHKKKLKWLDHTYKQMIIKMNDEIYEMRLKKQQQHLFPE